MQRAVCTGASGALPTVCAAHWAAAGDDKLLMVAGDVSNAGDIDRLVKKTMDWSGQADVILEVTGSGMSNIGDITVEPGFSKDVAIGRNGQIKLKDSAKPVDVIYDLLGGIEA